MAWSKGIRRQSKRSSAPDTICLLPWLNLSVDVDGSSRPCCKFDHTADVHGAPLLNLESATLAEVWDSPGLVQLRTEFAAGKKPAGCASCWAEEDSGVPSFRQRYLSDRGIDPTADITDVHPPQPKGLDLKLSNTCNLACRICGPVASSRWLTEELAQPVAPARSGFVAYLTDNRRYLADNKLTGRADDRATLEAWAPDVEHLELTGGEPMLSKESAEVLELLVDQGRPERMTLQVTTNATTISRRIVDHLHRFRSVTISLSVDDIGPRLEYQRDPAVWSEVEANIARYAAMASESVEVYLNATISTLNAWDLPDYLAWWDGAYPDGDIRFALNFLHDPAELCVQHLPEPVKAAMVERWDRHPARRRERIAPLLDQAQTFVTARRADPRQWPLFLEHTRELDARRGQHFESVYPELTEVFRSLGAWTPTEAGT